MKSIGLVALFGASQGFLLCLVILAVGTGNRLANRFLAAYVFVESTRLILAFIAYSELPLPQQFYYVFNLSMAAGPLVYLYVRALTDEHLSLSSRMLLHFTPVLLGILASAFYRSDFYLGPSVTQSEQWFDATTRSSGVIAHAIMGTTIKVIYLIASLRCLGAHEENIRDQFSSLEKINLGWLKTVIFAGLAAAIFFIGYDVLRLFFGWSVEPKFWGSIVFTIFIVYVISIGGLRQPIIFRPATSKGPDLGGAPDAVRIEPAAPAFDAAAEASEPGTSPKYERSGLDDERSLALWERLQRFMESERPYLDSKLSLRSLTAALDAIPQDLSQAINTHAGENFYEYVNRHRVDAAMALLDRPENDDRSLLDIGLDAGFNSQATFYKHFKKRTGTTPKAYRKLGREGAPLPAE